MQYEGGTPKEVNYAFLSNTEREWLLGNIQVSKSFEYKMRSSIRKKVQMLFELDIPLLIKNNFIASTESDTEALGRAESTRPVHKRNYKALGKVEVGGSNPSKAFSLYYYHPSHYYYPG
jgi:hypothetical protein